MGLTDETGGIGATMLVSPTANGIGYPVYTGANTNNGFGCDGWWIVLLIILLAAGNGFGGYGNNGGFGGPVIVNDGNGGAVQRGFDQASIMSGITGINSGVQNLATQMCNGFSDTQMALANGFAGVEQGANAREIANMQSMFGIQTALQNCCCENRSNIADLKYTVATENCADRQALNEGVRDILSATQAQTQAILTQLCNDKIEQKNDTIAQLRQELIFARGQASQDVQTAELRANNATVANQLLSEMRSCPIPAQPVYGTTPIFTCGGSGCGCGNV